MKFKISEQQPVAQAGLQQTQPVVSPSMDQTGNLIIPPALLQNPRFIQNFNRFLKQNKINFVIPIPKPVKAQPVQQPVVQPVQQPVR